MNRRSFLSRLLAGATGLLAAPVALAAATPPPRRVVLQESPLAGFRYYEAERLWPQLRIGQPLTLRRCPDNPHDQRAVEIWWQDRMLGHLPRLDNAAVAQMLDRGERLEARIAALTRDPDPWKRIGVAVELAA